MVQVSGREIGYRSRSYVFSENGILLVFNSFGDSGSISKDTGARTFYILPAASIPDFEIETQGSVRVRTASGVQAEFSPATGMLEDFSEITFREVPEISADNDGGVELSPSKQPGESRILVLDAGWAVGHVAQQDPSGSSFVRLGGGRSCEMPNKVLFDYSDALDPKLKFDGISAISKIQDLMSTFCPGFNSRSRPDSR